MCSPRTIAAAPAVAATLVSRAAALAAIAAASLAPAAAAVTLAAAALAAATLAANALAVAAAVLAGMCGRVLPWRPRLALYRGSVALSKRPWRPMLWRVMLASALAACSLTAMLCGGGRLVQGGTDAAAAGGLGTLLLHVPLLSD